MPSLSRWMIKLSLFYFTVSAGLGMCLLINKAYPFYPEVWQYLPVHIELMIFGWVIQFTLGTAYWILPRFMTTKGRGNIWMAILMASCLNAGIILIVWSNIGIHNELMGLVGRILEAMAVALFIALHWERIVSYGHS